MLTSRRPISEWWTLSLVPQNCIHEKWHLLVQGILTIIADFLSVFLPLPVVLALHLPRKQRIIVAILFGAGFVVCIAGIFRTYFLYKLTLNYRDVTWDAFPVWLSTAVELYLGIVRTVFRLCFASLVYVLMESSFALLFLLPKPSSHAIFPNSFPPRHNISMAFRKSGYSPTNHFNTSLLLVHPRQVQSHLVTSRVTT